MSSAAVREELTCGICLDVYTNPLSLRCGHYFCENCILAALASQKSKRYTCPECRAKYAKRPRLEKNRKLCNIVERFRATEKDQKSPTIRGEASEDSTKELPGNTSSETPSADGITDQQQTDQSTHSTAQASLPPPNDGNNPRQDNNTSSVTTAEHTSGVNREWQQHLPQSHRNDLITRFVKAIFPPPGPAAQRHLHIENLVAFAKKVESDAFNSANNREEYNHFLAEKLCKPQIENEEKWRSCLQNIMSNKTL